MGQSSRQEVADGTGKVEGSYTVTNDEGHTRIVDYVADQYGFRANIRTNEPGTDNKNPADVMIESAAPLTPYQYVPRYRNPYVAAPVLSAPVAAPVLSAPVAAPILSAPVAPPVAAPVLPAEVLRGNTVTAVQPGLYNAPLAYRQRNYIRPRPRYPYVSY